MNIREEILINSFGINEADDDASTKLTDEDLKNFWYKNAEKDKAAILAARDKLQPLIVDNSFTPEQVMRFFEVVYPKEGIPKVTREKMVNSIKKIKFLGNTDEIRQKRYAKMKFFQMNAFLVKLFTMLDKRAHTLSGGKKDETIVKQFKTKSGEVVEKKTKGDHDPYFTTKENVMKVIKEIITLRNEMEEIRKISNEGALKNLLKLSSNKSFINDATGKEDIPSVIGNMRMINAKWIKDKDLDNFTNEELASILLLYSTGRLSVIKLSFEEAKKIFISLKEESINALKLVKESLERDLDKLAKGRETLAKKGNMATGPEKK